MVLEADFGLQIGAATSQVDSLVGSSVSEA